MIFLLISCKKEKEEIIVSPKSVLVYMSANNNLAAEAMDNINHMESGFGAFDGKLIVYARVFGQSPKIYEIVHDRSPRIVSKVLKTYPEHNASDPEVMKMVFRDMQDLSRSESYGAILWSHATNWHPGTEKKMTKLKSFGEDGGKTMDIMDLKRVLPRNLDYLIFDACSMGSVEVLYELRDIVPLVLASPTEVISVGMPYDRIVEFLLMRDSREGLKRAAQLYYEFYSRQQGQMQSATFSLVDMGEMDNLAKAMREVIEKHPGTVVHRESVQRLDLDVNAVNTVPAFDLLDFCAKNYPRQDYEMVRQQVNRTVLYKVNTSHFLGTPINAFSGLSCYIPSRSESRFFKYYQSLNWSRVSSYFRLFQAYS
jgi:hypothetical protein